MMNEEVFYDTKNVSLTDRESFNNTILLLSMVKSSYYYIIGFSRPEEKIVIGFDFHSNTEGTYTKEAIIDFQSSAMFIEINCNIVTMDELRTDKIESIQQMVDCIRIEDNMLKYFNTLEKNSILPSSIKKMNQWLLLVRREIGAILKNIV